MMEFAAGFVFFALLFLFGEVLWGNRSIPYLSHSEPILLAECPFLSIVVAARNEERTIEKALRSLLALDYPNREIIVVNDRSTDGTPRILEQLAREFAELRVVTVSELPAGWLGKNHALHRGFQLSKGELVLFTDADVHFERSALRRAVAFLERDGWDHVTVAPEFRMGTVAGAVSAGMFALGFAFYMKPWRAAWPTSRYSIGIGAFNLVRRNALRAVGGLEPIRLRPDDDLMLGKLLKTRGFRQCLIWGKGMVWVVWYQNVPEMVRGLEKNALAPLGYSYAAAFFAVLALLYFHVFPWVGLFVGPFWVRFYSAKTLGLLALGFALHASRHGTSPWLALFFPIGSVTYLWFMVNAMWKLFIRRGIVWRGTYYPLRELKESRFP